MNFAIGTWRGFYEFGAGYPLPYFAGRVEFEIELKEIGGQLSGTCRDFESEISDPLDSEIEGYAENNLISLRKTYEHSSLIEEDGSRTQKLNEKTVLFYTGQYDSKRDCLFGFWEISAEENAFVDDERFANLGGIWKCERINL